MFVLASWRLIYEIPLDLIGTLLIIGFVLAARGMRHERREAYLKTHGKRYRMRGYGGNPRYHTSLHPRQAKQGKRIVYIPGVGYRHVQSGSSKPKG
jgi:hypothetical protein